MRLRGGVVRAAELERALSFVEQYVLLNFGVRPTFEEEMKEAFARIPARLWVEIKVGVRTLLTRAPETRGRFMVLTGLNGSGKETYLQNPGKRSGVIPIIKLLRQWGYHPLAIKSPSRTRVGSLISYLLGDPIEGTGIRGKLSVERLWMLWSLDRAIQQVKAASWLAAGRDHVVVAKRWTESNITYHGPLGVESRRILDFERNLLKPALTILLDAPVAECVRRNRRPRLPPGVEASSLPRIRESFLRLRETYAHGRMLTVRTDRDPRIVSGDLADGIARILTPLRT